MQLFQINLSVISKNHRSNGLFSRLTLVSPKTELFYHIENQ